MEKTLRDEFAIAALAGGLEQGAEDDFGDVAGPDVEAWWHSPEMVAKRAYAIADAMLEQRKK